MCIVLFFTVSNSDWSFSLNPVEEKKKKVSKNFPFNLLFTIQKISNSQQLTVFPYVREGDRHSHFLSDISSSKHLVGLDAAILRMEEINKKECTFF